eukprot:761339-Hanusia_phi.AAC.1
MRRACSTTIFFLFFWQIGDGTRSFLDHAAAFSHSFGPVTHPRWVHPFSQSSHACPRAKLVHAAATRRRPPLPAAAGSEMSFKLQAEQKEALKQGRWWDPIWRQEQIETLKDPEKQFDKEALEMAEMLGMEVEEFVRTMSGTAKVTLSSSSYDSMLVMCVRAAQSGDLLGMVHAKELLTKMEEVGISPDVELYNQVLSACSAAAGGVVRPCPVRNDTEERREFVEMAVKVVSYCGGKASSEEFARRWRGLYPNSSIHNYTYTEGKKQSTWKVLAQSARFEVEDGEGGSKLIVLRRRDGKEKKKSTTTISSSSSSSSSRNPWIQVGLDFLESMRRNKVEPNGKTYNVLISMCARAAKQDDSEMISQSFKLFDEMKQRKIPVEKQTLNALMNVCAKSKNLERMKDVEREYEAADIQPDVYVCSAKMRAARACQDVIEILEGMKKNGVTPNLASLNTALVSIHDQQQGAEGVRCAKVVMEQMKSLGLQPDASSYTTFLSILAGAAKRDEDGERFASEAIRLFEELKQEGAIKADVRTYTTVFHALTGVGLKKRIFQEEMRGANMSKMALQYLLRMREEQVMPDRRAFLACLSAMAQAAKIGGRETMGHVNEIWRMMEKVYLLLNIELYFSSLFLLSRFPQQAKVPMDLDCYKTLLQAYSNAVCA